MKPIVRPFLDSPSSTWSYLLRDPHSRAAAIIDPLLDFDVAAGRTATHSAQRLLDAVRDEALDVRWILETHAHADHLSAGHWLRQQLRTARLGIGRGITIVQRTFAEIFDLGADFAVDGSQFDHLFDDGECFAMGGINGRVIATPGHTSDSVSYLLGDALFVGDSLFMPDGGTARCDFPGGSAAILFRSIQRLFELPADTRVFVCHDYAPGGREHACETTIAAQREANIHVGGGVDEASFVDVREKRDAGLSVPALLLPAVQVNIRAGALPPAAANGLSYLKLPLNRF